MGNADAKGPTILPRALENLPEQVALSREGRDKPVEPSETRFRMPQAEKTRGRRGTTPGLGALRGADECVLQLDGRGRWAPRAWAQGVQGSQTTFKASKGERSPGRNLTLRQEAAGVDRPLPGVGGGRMRSESKRESSGLEQVLAACPTAGIQWMGVRLTTRVLSLPK